jgi:hypothetical protein
MLASEYRIEVENTSSVVGRAKPSRRCCIQEDIPDLVALTLLEVVALSATSLEEVGALLGVTLSKVLVYYSFCEWPLEAARRQRRAETQRRCREFESFATDSIGD